jgi:hypothetical protein
MPPFRSARTTDPYYKRLAHKDKKYFWKIFEGFKIDTYFKDLFEKMTCMDPSQRISLDQVIQCKFFQATPIDEHAAKCELLKIYQNLSDSLLFNY